MPREAEWETIVRRLRERESADTERRELRAAHAIELAESLLVYHAANLSTTEWDEFNKASARYQAALSRYKQVRNVP